MARLQVKACQIGKLLQTLESKSAEENGKKTASQLSKQKSENGPPVKKPHYIDPIPPFNANKIRKSPSASLTSSETSGSTSKTASATVVASVSSNTVNKVDTSTPAVKANTTDDAK